MVLSSIVSKSMLGIIWGSILENIEFVMESLILKISPDSPHTSNESFFSSMPKIIFPPKPFAKATTDFKYFLCSAGTSFFTSILLFSPYLIYLST